MDGIIFLIIVALVVFFVLPIVALVKASGAKLRTEELESQLEKLERRLQTLERRSSPLAGAEQVTDSETTLPRAYEKSSWLAKEAADFSATKETPMPPKAFAEPICESLQPPPLTAKSSDFSDIAASRSIKTESLPTSSEARSEEREQPEVAPSNFNWELFMGAKLFAWLGGLALFLGVVFFVKYAVEHSLISVQARVAIGFMTGVALAVSGAIIRRKMYAVLAQTLCATGVLILYAVTFASHAYYHFQPFTNTLTFSLMAIITATAFLFAVRMNAVAVAVLGMLGGFLTPILLSTGEDRPLALFVYIALLDVGLVAAAIKRRWAYLVPLAAFGTMAMQFGWLNEFFIVNHYAAGNRLLIPFAVLLGFQFLFLFAMRCEREGNARLVFAIGAILSAVVSWISACYFVSFDEIAVRAGWIFGFMTLVDLGVIAFAISDRRVALAQMFSGFLAFGLLAYWTADFLTPQRIVVVLIFDLLFALLHTALPLAMNRKYPANKMSSWLAAFPILSLLLILIPIFKLDGFSISILPFVLFVDLLAFVVAVVLLSFWSLIVMLLLTLILLGGWILKIPMTVSGVPDGLPFTLGAILFFSLAFIAAGIWASQKLKTLKLQNPSTPLAADNGDVLEELPMLSALTPFGLLILAMSRLPLVNPSPVFGVALLLIFLLLGIAAWKRSNWLPLISLIAIFLLETTWHLHGYSLRVFGFHHARLDGDLMQTLLWSALFYAVFTAFPFLFRRRLEVTVGAWMTSSLAGIAQFYWVHNALKLLWPNALHGLIPAMFAVVPGIALWWLAKKIPAQQSSRNAILAWFGGVACFFVTLIFPISFHHEWLTVGWALEGAALCALFRKIPHRGLRLAGVGLLGIVFVRLAFNPAVLEYHSRSATPVFNWFLYTYGIAALSFFAAARLLNPPRQLVANRDVRWLLCAGGGALVFLLINIEIADYFTQRGSRTLTLDFSENFGRDMSFSIAWALFALVLLLIGFAKNLRSVRYTSLALLGVTLLKLFFHDLAQLAQLYRIVALVVVAIIAMAMSFLYQRFFNAKKESESDLENR